jgi:hypothetical protein
MTTDTDLDLSIAGAAISMALIDTLMRKGILERGQAFAVLEAAEKRCAVLGHHSAEKVVRDFRSKMSAGG